MGAASKRTRAARPAEVQRIRSGDGLSARRRTHDGVATGPSPQGSGSGVWEREVRRLRGLQALGEGQPASGLDEVRRQLSSASGQQRAGPGSRWCPRLVAQRACGRGRVLQEDGRMLLGLHNRQGRQSRQQQVGMTQQLIEQAALDAAVVVPEDLT